MRHAFPRIGATLVLGLVLAAVPGACSPEDNACAGGTSPCVVLDEASCASVSNGACSWGSACDADCLTTDPTTCQSLAKQKTCYLAYTKQCVPRDDNACKALTRTACGETPGCLWAETCNGSVPCSSLADEHDCNQRLQCSWQPSSQRHID